MRNILSETEAKALLQLHFTKWIEIILDSFQVYQQFNTIRNIDGSMIELKYSTPALIHDIITSRLKQYHQDDVEFIIGFFDNMFSLIFPGKAFIRIKKLNEDLKPSNVSTERQNKIDKQLPIDGLQEETYITLGYLPDDSWTTAKGIYLVCWRNDVNLWAIDLNSGNTMGQSSIDFVSSPPKPDLPRPKISVKEEVKKR